MGLGLFRVLLAMAVVITHTHPIFGFTFGNPVIAVRAFFIISGFYMALILNEKYKSTGLFFRNRALRIFPIYWTVLFLTIIIGLVAFLLKGNWGEMEQYALYIKDINPFISFFAIITNLTIFGRELIMFSNVDLSTGLFCHPFGGQCIIEGWKLLLVPQAWTLTLELLFYLIAPFIVRKKIAWLIALLCLSIGIKYAMPQLGHSDVLWTYRFFPSELCYFIMGTLAYKIYGSLWFRERQFKYSYVSVWIIIFFLLTFNNIPEILNVSIFAVEWIFYVTVMLMLPFAFSYSKNNAFDRNIGELSYPIYISHILVNNIVNPIIFVPFIRNSNYQAIVVFSASVVFSIALLKYIQNPIEKVRKKSIGLVGPFKKTLVTSKNEA